VQPSNTNRVALLQPRHAGAQRTHDARALVSGNKGKRRFHRPVPVRGMQVSVTDAARHDLDQYLAGSRRRQWHVLNREWPTERTYHGRLHRLRHQTSSGAGYGYGNGRTAGPWR
jgi:hypothetical protein